MTEPTPTPDRLQPGPKSGREPNPLARRGAGLPTGVVLLSIAAIVVAALAFFTVGDDAPTPPDVAQPARSTTTPTPTTEPDPEPSEETTPDRPRRPPVVRSEVPVEVYNNTGIVGLAADVGEQASSVGWNVVDTDNWFGTIPTTTVYYPPDLRRAARQLALDLGIDATEPAVEPMELDRVTVILTGAL